jgi:hypothetical protein
VFGWRCRFLAEGLAERFNIPLANLIHLPYHELEYITFVGTFAEVTGGARQFLNNAAIIPRLFLGNPLAALQALQEFGCSNQGTIEGQLALTIANVSRNFPSYTYRRQHPDGGGRGGAILLAVAGGVVLAVGGLVLWDELTRPLEFRLSGFDQKVGSLAGHLAKLLNRNVAGFGPSPDPNPYGDPNRGWCNTIRRVIQEIDGAGYSDRQLNRDLERAGISTEAWNAIKQAVKDAAKVCKDHWDDFTGGSLVTG